MSKQYATAVCTSVRARRGTGEDLKKLSNRDAKFNSSIPKAAAKVHAYGQFWISQRA